ncbi:hypothetical protein M33023_00350 [Candidatus Phytoplasma asteris]|uniref:Uncharacterized protein n=1 Tax=Candidatus Phytoplasma asteris TaxID=85620 RepID=A0ABZ2YEB0_9MOLU
MIVYLDNYVRFKKQQHKGPSNYLTLKYKAPKQFLNDDKDYCLGSAFVDNDKFEFTYFHLHFNPIRQIFSLCQDKHNYDKI